MSAYDQFVHLCGEFSGSNDAPAHDSLHVSEQEFAVHPGAISEAEVVARIPTVNTVTRFEGILPSRRSGTGAGGITKRGAWLNDAIA